MAWIGDTYTSDVGWNLLVELADCSPRLAGSDGERAAAEATRERLDEYARETRIEPFTIQGWERGDSRIQADGESYDPVALPRSPSTEASGELVDCGHGLPEEFDRDLEGAVVMVSSGVPDWYERLVHRREKYYSAVEAGATGFVFRHHEPGCLEITGGVGRAEQPVGEIPAVGVSYEVGKRLARRAAGKRVTVGVDATLGEADSYNVRAELGPDTDERLLVTSHIDAHDISEGALDNAAGTATVVEIARAIADREAELDTRVEFVCFGAEEVGLQGSSRLAEMVAPESVRAVVNLDGVARGREITVGTQGFDGIEAATETVADRFDHPLEVDPRISPHSDHWPFIKRGIPGCHVFSNDLTRGWGHTPADTVDKLDVRDLRNAAVVLTELVVELADERADLEPKSFETLEAELEAQNLVEGLRVMGDYPTRDF